MNGKDIFLGLKYIGEDLIQEAEFGAFSSQKEQEQKPRRFRRPLLIAAVIALSVLLVGCAVVYVMRMQDLQIGEKTGEKAIYETYGTDIVDYEAATYQVLTLSGLKGSPGYRASQEWYAYKQSYDPDYSLFVKLDNEGAVPEFPAEYSAYLLYTQEMKDKLDALMEENGLKPLGAPLQFRTVKNMCAALNVDRLQTAKTEVTIQVGGGSCWENGNFRLNLDFTLPESEDGEVYATWGVLSWNRKDCLSEEWITIEDTGDWREWNYTTTSGSNVLLMCSPSDWRGWILCEREEAFLALQIETRKDLWTNEDGKTWAEEVFLTDRQIEQIADAVDFGIQPRMATREDVENQPDPSGELTQDGYRVELKQVQTDGWLAYITLGITAPEGTVISHTTREGYEAEPYHIRPANFDELLPEEGEMGSRACPWNPVEDHDGKDNTQDFLIECNICMDGGDPFDPGKVWTLWINDLVHSYYDDKNYQMVEEVLAEGEWLFSIRIEPSMGDFREMELIQTPVTTQAAVAMTRDGKDVYEDVQITSFVLRRLSATLLSDNPSADFINEQIFAVLKDGTKIPLQYRGLRTLFPETPLDLEQVDHVLLSDGTKLPATQIRE